MTDQKLTNFEKWKDSLTAEFFADMILESGEFGDLCDYCPVSERKDCGPGFYCNRSFLAWANKDAR